MLTVINANLYAVRVSCKVSGATVTYRTTFLVQHGEMVKVTAACKVEALAIAKLQYPQYDIHSVVKV